MTPKSGPNLGEALLADMSDRNFLPCPQITLFADAEASLGICGICQTTQLELQPGQQDTSTQHTHPSSCPSSYSSSSDPAVAILPCGHVACHACMSRCLESRAQCPFCRLPLRYELCCHPLRARVLTRANLLSTPDTVPMGGRIPDQCPACRVGTNRVASESILASLADSFQTLRGQYNRASAGDARGMALVSRRLQALQQQFQLVAKALSAETVAALTSQW